NGFKLKEGIFRLDLRVSVLRHWKRLPGEAMDASSLEDFKASLDGTLSNL
ncbi:hypothetical protein N325_03340, partial [Colius striatus]